MDLAELTRFLDLIAEICFLVGSNFDGVLLLASRGMFYQLCVEILLPRTRSAVAGVKIVESKFCSTESVHNRD